LLYKNFGLFGNKQFFYKIRKHINKRNQFIIINYKLIKEGSEMPVEFDNYNGNPVIILKRDENDAYPFRFGIRKAELIIENIEKIKKFVKENSK
jgi:hypothetical protein